MASPCFTALCLAAPVEPHSASSGRRVQLLAVEAGCSSVLLWGTTTAMSMDRHVCRWQGACGLLAASAE